MARIYSRKKGKAGSTKPAKKTNPTWLRYKPQEVEIFISKLAKEGKTSSQIGIALRDTYGIPDVKLAIGKSIMHVMKEKNLARTLPEDLLSLIKKTVILNKHRELNKHDMTAKRGMTINNSKIKRLVDYYKKKGTLTDDWKFDPENARMYLE